MAYPWRAVWTMREEWRAESGEEERESHPEEREGHPEEREGHPEVTRFLISVPKKRLKHAVDRVKMRRRCREAYRLNRELLTAPQAADIAFVYVGNGVTDYIHTEKAVKKILTRISAALTTENDTPTV